MAIIERGPAGIARVVFANDAFARLADAATSDMIGRDLRTLLDPSLPPRQLAQLETRLGQGQASGAVLPLRVANADPVAWQFDFEPLPAAAGKTVSHWLLQLREPD